MANKFVLSGVIRTTSSSCFYGLYTMVHDIISMMAAMQTLFVQMGWSYCLECRFSHKYCSRKPA